MLHTKKKEFTKVFDKKTRKAMVGFERPFIMLLLTHLLNTIPIFSLLLIWSLLILSIFCRIIPFYYPVFLLSFPFLLVWFNSFSFFFLSLRWWVVNQLDHVITFDQWVAAQPYVAYLVLNDIHCSIKAICKFDEQIILPIVCCKLYNMLCIARHE